MPQNRYMLCSRTPDDPDSPSLEEYPDPFFRHGVLDEKDEDPEKKEE